MSIKASQSLTALGLALNAVAAELSPEAWAAIAGVSEQLASAAVAQAKTEAQIVANDIDAATPKLTAEAVTFFDGALNGSLSLLSAKLSSLGPQPAPKAPEPQQNAGVGQDDGQQQQQAA